MKRIAVIAFCCVFLFLTGCSNKENEVQEQVQAVLEEAIENVRDAENAAKQNDQNLESDEDAESKEKEAEIKAAENAEYLEVSIKQLFDDMGENPIKAEQTYLNQYIVVSGVYKNFLYDKSFTITDNIIENGNDIFCELIVDGFENALSDECKNQKITIWGKVTSIQPDSNAYWVDVYSLEFASIADPDTAEYIEVTVDGLIKACEEDSYTAQELYLGAYIVFPAYIKDIELEKVQLDDDPPSNDPFVRMIALSDGYIDGWYSTEKVRSSVAEYSTDDYVTVWGRVTDIVVTTIGTSYDVEILKIE